MYALHEHGESHDESSESEYKLKKKSATENNGIRDGDATETEVDPDSILGDDLQPTNAKIGTYYAMKWQFLMIFKHFLKTWFCRFAF